MPLMFLINAVGDPRTAGFLSYTLLCRNLKFLPLAFLFLFAEETDGFPPFSKKSLPWLNSQFLPLALFVKPPYAVPDTGGSRRLSHDTLLLFCNYTIFLPYLPASWEKYSPRTLLRFPSSLTNQEDWKKPQNILCECWTGGRVCAIINAVEIIWAISSVGRALRSHRKGRGFESHIVHQ